MAFIEIRQRARERAPERRVRAPGFDERRMERLELAKLDRTFMPGVSDRTAKQPKADLFRERKEGACVIAHAIFVRGKRRARQRFGTAVSMADSARARRFASSDSRAESIPSFASIGAS